MEQLSRLLPVEGTETDWRIGAGYDEEKNEIGLSFSPILSRAESRAGLSFSQIIAACLSLSKEVQMLEIKHPIKSFQV